MTFKIDTGQRIRIVELLARQLALHDNYTWSKIIGSAKHNELVTFAHTMLATVERIASERVPS